MAFGSKLSKCYTDFLPNFKRKQKGKVTNSDRPRPEVEPKPKYRNFGWV